MFPNTWSGNFINWKWNDFKMTSWVDGTTLKTNMKAYSETKISGFRGVVIIFSPANVASDNLSKGWNMSLAYQNWNDWEIYTMASFAPDFGPSFHPKCFFGFNRINYKGGKSFTYELTNSANGNYTLMDLPDSSQLNPEGYFFCFGNQSAQCGETESMFDNTSQTCHAVGKCPLKEFSTWTETSFCPKCAQLICNKCTASNRKNCFQCGINSTLSSGVCVCNSDSWPFNTAISTSAEGLWDNTASSLTECKYNCTAQMNGCVFDKCNTGTFCTQCLTGYYLEATASTITQGCVSCTTLVDCVECTNAETCTLCITNYFPVSGTCTLCREIIPNCNSCKDASTCGTCDSGFEVTASGQCSCSPLLGGMSNCKLCTVTSACDQCESTMFFISVADSMCHSCRNFDPYCITCSAENVCSSCDLGYTIVTVGVNSVCKACWQLFPNCTLCSSPTACDLCNTTYGLTLTATCQICSTLLMPGCESCKDSNECLTCVNNTHLINGKCNACTTIMNCETCFVNSAVELQCNLCTDGYYLNISGKTGKPYCIPCMYFTDYCQKCNHSQCLSCAFPYLIGSDGLCSKCETGFHYVSGVCTNIAGCVQATYQSNGSSTCLACASNLHFTYDSKLQKCVCMQGFKEFNSIGLLPQCHPVCGDGIVLSQFEQCDDNNSVTKDGCDQMCKVQPGFDCGFLQPSKCKLELDIILFKFNYVSRVLGQNKGIISFTILPGHSGLQSFNWQKLISLKFPPNAVTQSLLSYSYNSQTGQLQVIVPYNQQLQDTILQTQLTLNPKQITSKTPFLSLVSELKGINSKLIFQNQSELQTHKNINSITDFITILLLLVFYLGSYVHKMIGLETIQLIQVIYFVRMVVPSTSTSLLTSINRLQYSTSGYQNSKWIYGDISKFQGQMNALTTEQFTVINLKKLFILNANLTLVPVVLAILVYGITLVRKYRARNQYLQTKAQEFKDKYTQFQRSSLWVYDHFVFPYSMMFNLLNFFQIVSLLSLPFQTDTNQLKNIEIHSFFTHTFMVFCATSIYCFQISASYQDYNKFKMPQKEKQRLPKSVIQQLEHDQNNNDRANYHPAYVLCNLIYHFILSVVMIFSVIVPEFGYSLEFTSGIAFFYFLFIWIWPPYHHSIKTHNFCLNIYNGIFCLFLIICNLFIRLPKLSGSVYTGLMYLIVILLGTVVGIGLIRIFLQQKFRNSLQQNSSLMQWSNKSDLKEPLSIEGISDTLEGKPVKMKTPREKKLESILQKNIYTMENQLFEMQKKLNILIPFQSSKQLSSDQRRQLMKKVREDIQQRKINQMVEIFTSQQEKAMGTKCKTPSGRQMSSKEQTGDLSKEHRTREEPENIYHKIVHGEAVSNVQNLQQKIFLKELKQQLRAEWASMQEE